MPSDLLSTIRAEIAARLTELRPLILEYEQLLAASEALDREGSAADSPGASASGGPGASPAGSPPSTAPAAGTSASTKAPRRNEASAAILAALEHGSHTTAELTVVTGLSAASIRRDLRLLLGQGVITRTTRAGKTAYTLST